MRKLSIPFRLFVENLKGLSSQNVSWSPHVANVTWIGAMVEEIRSLAETLQVERTLEAWRLSMQELTAPAEGKPSAFYHLLYLDAREGSLEILNFPFGELLKAQEAYARAEKRAEGKPGAQAVLVSVEELSLLRRAYPNYFLDTRMFLNEVRRVTGRRPVGHEDDPISPA